MNADERFTLVRHAVFGDIGKYPSTLLVWIHLLVRARAQTQIIRRNGVPEELSAGSVRIALRKFAEDIKVDVSSVRRSLDYLEKRGSVCIVSDTQGTTITIHKLSGEVTHHAL